MNRKRVIHKLGIPELRKIYEYTFRIIEPQLNIKSMLRKTQLRSCLAQKRSTDVQARSTCSHLFGGFTEIFLQMDKHLQ